MRLPCRILSENLRFGSSLISAQGSTRGLPRWGSILNSTREFSSELPLPQHLSSGVSLCVIFFAVWLSLRSVRSFASSVGSLADK